MSRSRSPRYAAVAIVLHWTIAALIALQVVLASRMDGPPTPEAFAVVQLHKSVGITVLLLSLLRLAWRLTHPPPPDPPTLKAWELTLARITHWAFYGVMIGMPLTGWIMVSTSRIALPTMLYGVVGWPMIPGLGDLAPEVRQVWHAASEFGHETLIRFAYGLIALHAAGAMKHQLFSRDEPVLARMAPGARPGRWLEPRLLVILLAASGVIAFGQAVQPPRSAAARQAASAAPVAESVPVQPPAAEVAPKPAGLVRWVVQPGSTLAFATQWSGTAIEGRFRRWTADIVFSPEALAESEVTVSIDMGSADTGDAQRDATLPSGDWLDAAGHPNAVFTASRFSRIGEGRYVAHGRLSLRGVTKPLDLPFRLAIDGDAATASGAVGLDRVAFGVGQGEFAATDQIPGQVMVRIDVKAKRSDVAAATR